VDFERDAGFVGEQWRRDAFPEIVEIGRQFLQFHERAADLEGGCGPVVGDLGEEIAVVGKVGQLGAVRA